MERHFLLLAWVIPAFVGSSLLTRFLIGWASQAGVLDRPNERSSHTKVTPRGGGLAIVVVTSIAAVISAVTWPESRLPLLGIVGASLAIAYVSWLDDLKSVPNRVRFGIHLASAALVAFVAGPIQTVDLGCLGTLHLGFAAWPLTLLWIVGMTNAFNFMDGVDGIAGITAAAAGAALATAGFCLESVAVGVVASVFASASIGFLTCNWPPARIFMGDVGSAFCGFVVAVLPTIAAPNATSRMVTVALFAMWPFIFDTIYTIIRRLSKGEDIFKAHRSHLYQRLVTAGWRHRTASSLYGLLAATAAATILVPFYDKTVTSAMTNLALTMLPVIAILLLILVHFAETAASSVAASGRKASPLS